MKENMKKITLPMNNHEGRTTCGAESGNRQRSTTLLLLGKVLHISRRDRCGHRCGRSGGYESCLTLSACILMALPWQAQLRFQALSAGGLHART